VGAGKARISGFSFSSTFSPCAVMLALSIVPVVQPSVRQRLKADLM
jgi:hypothetical protein